VGFKNICSEAHQWLSNGIQTAGVDKMWGRPWPRPQCTLWPTLWSTLWPFKNTNKTSVGVERVAGIKLLTHFSTSLGMETMQILQHSALEYPISHSLMSSPAKQSVIMAG